MTAPVSSVNAFVINAFLTPIAVRRDGDRTLAVFLQDDMRLQEATGNATGMFEPVFAVVVCHRLMFPEG